MRAPLAPPRLSVPRNVEADDHAVRTNSDTVRPLAMIFDFNSAISAAVGTLLAAGMGSCQISSSLGTSFPT